jgi:amino acid adenylation domain-containing protein
METREPVPPSPQSAPVLLPEAVFQRARTQPSAPALESPSGSLSYGELTERARAVAACLAAQGVGPEAVVALCLDRCLELGPGLLGILGSGAAYLPVDPSAPPARLAELVRDSGARCILTVARLAARCSAAGVPVICLDALPAGQGEPSAPAPERLAYVLYTSGSTGKPKGVLVEHGALATHAHGMASHYGLSPQDRVLQFASIAFDVAAEECFPSWCAGACVVLRDEACAASFQAFTRFLAGRRISVANLPAGFWQEWTAELLRGGTDPLLLPPTLRLVIAGSERVSSAALLAWKQRFGERVRWINGYGPTEATITATTFEPRAQDLDPDATAVPAVPIGFPLPWVQAYVLDAALREVPAGLIGQLALAGAGVARGYLGDPELTARRFVPDPFAGRTGARMYLTGDRARRRSDGALEFLGRDDDQVKLLGYRIELGEVEAALQSLTGVRAAAAVVREDVPGARSLVGYVTAHAGEPLDVAALRAELARRLPEYMVPPQLVLLESLPRTPGGKLDRRALPAPVRAPSGEVPRGPTEELLAGLWRELFGLDAVGREDHFFRLGGHSLLAMQLAGRLFERARVEVLPRTVFEHPTLAGLAAAIDRGAAAGSDPWPPYPPLTRVDRSLPIPLAASQEPVWFLLQLEPGLLAYNTQFSVRFAGALDPDCLRGALALLVERHEILRTTFQADGDGARQVIEAPWRPALEVIDVSALPADQRAAHAERECARLCARRFEVGVLPLVEWTLVCYGPQDWELVQVEHHFIHDGWSIALLLSDLARLYGDLLAARPPSLGPPPFQFADFVAWQRAMLSGPRRERLSKFWRERLQGAPAQLTLPTDRPRPPVQTFRGASEVLEIPPRLFQSLASLARREGFTPFQLLLTAFEILLSRHSGQQDIVIATAAANRRTREVEGIIGMMVNPVPIRVDTTGPLSVRQLAARVRSSALESFEHQDLPFEQMVQAASPPRDFAYNPVFQVLFSFHDSPVPDLDFGAARGRMVYRYNGSAKFDMNLVVIPRGEQRVGRARSEDDGHAIVEWEYNTDLFDRARVARMVAHFRNLLEGMEGHFDRPCAELPMLGPEERLELGRLNDTQEDCPAELGLYGLFRRQALATPDRPAVSCGEERATYAELHRLVRGAASELRTRGVQPGDVVGVHVERSLSMVALLLAISAAGAAYLPLDPALPAERLHYILGDAFHGATRRTVVTQASLAARLPPEFAAVALDLDQLFAAVRAAQGRAGEAGAEAEPSGAAGQDLAYVIYTSGSTGRPKGVLLTQRNLVNFLCTMGRRLPMGPGDLLAAVTTLSFDIAGLELYLPLCQGAAVHVATREESSDAGLLSALLAARRATFLQATPATWRMLVESGWGGAPSLTALCGGEALPLDLSAAISSRVKSLFNLYGPTETTIWSSIDELRPEAREVTIGKPIGNTRFYVLGPQAELLPPGAAGELWIGGAGVARGYHRRPELTAERFRPDPFAGPEERMYATGDLVRLRKDGRIEYLGRLDQQVKLRGFRIELGEIEVLLRALPGVLDAAVDLREFAPGDQRLVAWYVGEGSPGGEEEQAARLREGLARSLSEYMLPSAFVRLEALPRTHNGKLDRRALEISRSAGRRGEFQAPRGEIEERVAEIWRSVLGLERVGARDRFFDLGGHSLIAMRAILQLEAGFGVRIPPRDLMLQNLSQLAAAIAERRSALASPPPAAPGPEERAGEPSGGWISGLRGLFGKRPREGP